MTIRISFFIIFCLVAAGNGVCAEPAGTKGQNYDRIVLETPSDDSVSLTANVMTINRYWNSSATITVTDNGVTIFGPESDTQERWKRVVTLKGRGRHEIVMLCQSVNASPVYCSLDRE